MPVASRPGLPIAIAQPTVARQPPTGAGWLHEIKLDGYRLLAQRHGIGGRLLTRNGHDWSERYPAVLKPLMALMVRSCLIDGEVVICDERGVAVFDRLRHGPRVTPRGRAVRVRPARARRRGPAPGRGLE